MALFVRLSRFFPEPERAAAVNAGLKMENRRWTSKMMKKPRVDIDLSPLFWRNPSGISYYAYHLCQELEKLNLPFEPFYYAFSHRRANLQPPLSNANRLRRIRLPMRAAKKLWDWKLGRKLFGLNRADLFLALNSELPARTKKQKKVLVLHDLAGLKVPGIYSDGFLKDRLKTIRWGLEQADWVVVYSQTTRQDVCLFSSFPQERCRVIPLGVDANFFSQQTGENTFPYPYFFSNGMIQPRKNFALLAHAFLQAVREGKLPHQLLIAGGDGWRAEEIKREVKAMDAENRIQFLGYVPREKLATLYRNAAGFLFPSLYEGFGLPILEAMAAGAPVLTSNFSALPEVAGDAAWLVDPRNSEEIKKGITRLAEDENLAAELRRRGKKRAAQLSFGRTALQTANFLSEVLGIGQPAEERPALS